jgi:hypothetical protein
LIQVFELLRMPATGGSKNTWEGVLALAQVAGAKFPQVVAAQWALESGWGKHPSGKNNYLGLKALPGKGTAANTQEFEKGKWVAKKEPFLDFDSIDDCINYVVERWYKDYKDYKGVNRAATAEEAAQLLQTEGYGTDPEYGKLLIERLKERAADTAAFLEAGRAKPQSKTLLKISALRDTWLKKSVEGAEELGDKEKVAVPEGKIYDVLRFSEHAMHGHAEVELAHKAGTWFIYEPHWQKGTAAPPARVQLPSGGLAAQQPVVDWTDFSALVTPHLTVGEVLQYDKRRTPSAGSAMRARLLRTAAEFEAVRMAWGRPLGVTSFYRPEPINQQVGGVPGSRHVSGEAFDIYPIGVSLEVFYQWIRRRWTGGLGDGRGRGFVHLDTRANGHFVPGAGVSPYVVWTY